MKCTLIFLFCILSVNLLFCQKFTGGEIHVQQTGTYSVVARVSIYTSINDVMSSIKLCWGDGFCEEIPLVFLESYPGSNLKFHQFQQSHIYGQEDFYTLTIQECCWTANIINIENPETEEFTLSTHFFLNVNDPPFGENRMPFFAPGLLEGNSGMPINYNSNFSDFENDEVLVEICELDEVLFYYIPTDVAMSPFNQIFLDSLTSSFTWAVPQLPGRYILALCVTERRNGQLISEFTRKMMIAVDETVVSENIVKSKIEYFPNPVKDVLYLKIPTTIPDPYISLFDVNGRKVFTASSTNQLALDHLNNGIYFLHIHSGKMLFIEKLVLVR